MLSVFPPDDDRWQPRCAAVPEPVPPGTLLCAQLGHDFLLHRNIDGTLVFPDVSQVNLAALLHLHTIGALDGATVLTGVLPSSEALPATLTPVSLRSSAAQVGAGEWSAMSLASQVLHWDRTTRFCGECGGPMRVTDPAQRSKRCEGCEHSVFPRLAPCTITLVHDGDRLLLTRQPSWPPGRYGLVAGFVEPGETLEACVRREVYEETGLAVDDVTYQGSQPWPFPHQLMVGFTARHAGGDIALRDGELEDARWFDTRSLPMLPPPLSIARSLIDAFLLQRNK